MEEEGSSAQPRRCVRFEMRARFLPITGRCYSMLGTGTSSIAFARRHASPLTLPRAVQLGNFEHCPFVLFAISACLSIVPLTSLHLMSAAHNPGSLLNSFPSWKEFSHFGEIPLPILAVNSFSFCCHPSTGSCVG